jgi:hypothetical protein
MNFKYKLAEDKHAGTKGMFDKQLAQWDKEWEENKEKIAKLPKELQDKIKAAAKKALSENKCGGCKPIRK